MSLFSRKPRTICGRMRGGHLYQTDDDYIASRLEAKQLKSASDAPRHYVNLSVRVERQTEAGKDETMFAVVKKQEDVVREGTKPLAARFDKFDEKIDKMSGDLYGALDHLTAELAAVRQENLALKAVAERQAQRADQTLELTTICYGILRHYVLGFLVVRLSTVKFSELRNRLP